MAFDLLTNDSIPIKAVVGIAGAGKTKIALKIAFEKLKQGKYAKVFVVRHNVPVGENVGYLPGSKFEKMRPWFGPIVDNLDGGEFELETLLSSSQIEFDVPMFMQGRDLRNTFVVVDEAQLLTNEQVKMLGSRVGEGSVIAFVGDYDQVFNKKYKGNNNGLIRLIDVMKGKPEFGVVTLQRSVRGRVAELFATLL